MSLFWPLLTEDGRRMLEQLLRKGRKSTAVKVPPASPDAIERAVTPRDDRVERAIANGLPAHLHYLARAARGLPYLTIGSRVVLGALDWHGTVGGLLDGRHDNEFTQVYWDHDPAIAAWVSTDILKPER